MIYNKSHLWLLVSAWTCASTFGWADDKVTRVYLLKNADVSNISRVINIAVRDTSKTRLIGGNSKRLVISDTPDQQDIIAQLLPVLDQPISETDPDKIQMKMLMNAAQYLRQQKIAMKAAPSSASNKVLPAASTPAIAPGVETYDKSSSAQPYTSIYASDDAQLLQGPRILVDEPVLLSLSNLELKGIYQANTGSPLALLSFESMNYTARDGGLFENNHSRLKDVTSKVLKDRVILVGPDRIPREIKFKSTL